MKFKLNQSLSRWLLSTFLAAPSFLASIGMFFAVTTAQALTEIKNDGTSGGISYFSNKSDAEALLINFAAGYAGHGGRDAIWQAPKIYVQAWNVNSTSADDNFLLVVGDLYDGEKLNEVEGGTDYTSGDIIHSSHTAQGDYVFNGVHNNFSSDFVIASTNSSITTDFIFINRDAAKQASGVSVTGTGAIEFAIRTEASGDLAVNAAARDAILFYEGDVYIGNSAINAGSLILNDAGRNSSGSLVDISGANTTASNLNGTTSTQSSWGANYTISSALALTTLAINDASDVTLIKKETTSQAATIGTVNFGTNGSILTIDRQNVSIGTINTAATDASIVLNADSTLTLTGSSTLGSAASLTLNAGAGLTIDSGASLTIGGNLVLSDTITNNGSLTFSSGYLIDLSGLTAEIDGDRISYTLFTGTGSATFETLLELNFTGIDGDAASSYTVSYEDNVVTFTTLNDVYNFAGSSAGDAAVLDWAVGTGGFTGKDELYDNGAAVINFSGNTSATVNSDITIGQINVLENAQLALVGSGSIDTDTFVLNNNATLDLSVSLLAGTTAVTGSSSSTLKLHLDASSTGASNLDIDSYLGKLQIAAGNYTMGTEALAANAIEVLAGAALSKTAGVILTNPLFLKGGDTLEDAATLNLNNVNINSTSFNTTGQVIINAHTMGSIISQELSGTGTITKTGNANLAFHTNSTHTGTLDITAGTVKLGDKDTSTRTIAFSEIIIRTGATFEFQNGRTDFTSIQLDGGTFYNNDAVFSANNIQTLTVTKDSFFRTKWNGEYSITEMSGDGSLTFSDEEVPGASSNPLNIIISTLKDYNSTIDMGGIDRINLTLNNVNQGEGKSATITNLHGGLSQAGLNMSGAGELILDTTMTLSGALNQSGGTLRLQQASSASTATVSNASQLHLASTLTISDALNLSDTASITTQSGATITRKDSTNGSISKAAGASSFVIGENSITGASLTNLSIAGITDNHFSIDRSQVDLQSVTLSNVALKNTEVTGSISDGSTTQTLTTSHGESKEMLIFTMTGFTGVESIEGAMVFEIHLDDTQFDQFTSVFESNGLIGIALDGLTLDDLVGEEYADMVLKFYNAEGELYGGMGHHAIGSAIYDGDLVLYAPEPSTATLSLLALTGLLARRRRKLASV